MGPDMKKFWENHRAVFNIDQKEVNEARHNRREEYLKRIKKESFYRDRSYNSGNFEAIEETPVAQYLGKI